VRPNDSCLQLASLLGDNPNKSFGYDELKGLMGCTSREALCRRAYRLRSAGMSIEVSNNSIRYVEIQK
jgi:hypothetical protein